MSCAGCDDCPEDKWHIHVTVSGCDLFYKRDCESLGLRPLIIENWMWSGENKIERIPTLSFSGTEAKAQMRLIEICCDLRNLGYDILRAKIEGGPTSAGRALYFESHAKFRAGVPGLKRSLRDLGVPVSHAWSENKPSYVVATIRSDKQSDVHLKLFEMNRVKILYESNVRMSDRVECAVLDTCREMDNEWLNQDA